MLARRILVVDENQDSAEQVRKYIMSVPEWKACIVVACTLHEAGKLLDEPPPFDAVMLNLVLPNGQGIAVFQAIRDAACGVPILVYSGTPTQHTAEAILRDGCAAFMPLRCMSAESLRRQVDHAISYNSVAERISDTVRTFRSYAMSLAH